MHGVIKRLQNINFYGSKSLGVVSAFICFVMMLIVTMDVAGRYLFGRPFPGALEITEALLPIVIVFAFNYHELHGGHVRITLLSQRFSPRGQAISDVVAQASAFILFFILGWLTFDYALVAWTLKETSWGLVAVPLWIPKLAISVGCFGFALCSLIICLSKIINIRAAK